MKLLILGGTAEARKLAEKLGPRAVLSLAGATRNPLATPQRSGGFGGVAGLKNYLSQQAISTIIDATHPFAAQMSHNAATAAAGLGLPLLRLERAAWPESPDWINAETLPEAALRLPAAARVFLSVGGQSIAPFLARPDIWTLVRSIEPPAHFPRHGEVLLQRPPFTKAGEIDLMRRHAITHLVSKNAGGQATIAKLAAAAALGLQVIMVKRPLLPPVLTVESVAEAVKWIAQQKGII